MKVDITQLTDLKRVARDIVTGQINDANPLTLALHGDLGAGKTTFTQLLAAEMGVEETVTSPTFVIMKRYETSHQRWTNLIHIDAYRVEDQEELEVLGFSDWVKQKDTIICVEWAEKAGTLLPENTVHLYFTINGNERSLEIREGGQS